MTNPSYANEPGETKLRIALSEAFPEANYGAIPVSEQRNALAAYLAFDDGVMAAVPSALAAYITRQQRIDF